jgi:hypothetical protein
MLWEGTLSSDARCAPFKDLGRYIESRKHALCNALGRGIESRWQAVLRAMLWGCAFRTEGMLRTLRSELSVH